MKKTFVNILIRSIFLLLVLTCFSYADRIPNTFITKIPEIIKDNPPDPSMRWIKGTDIIMHFERDNQIGAAWYSYIDSTPGYWSYNYVRLDTSGNILVDLRNFAKEKVFWERFNICSDPYDPEPGIEYTTDNRGNSWLVYSYLDKQENTGWKIAWISVDKWGNVGLTNEFEENTLNHERYLICHSEKFGFHFIGDHYKHAYRNTDITKPIYFDKKYKKPYPVPAQCCVETKDNNILLVAQYLDSAEIHYQRISPKGKLLSVNRTPIDDAIMTTWENVELPKFKDIFHWNNNIWFITTVHSFKHPVHNRLFLIVFDKKGKIIKQPNSFTGQIMSIDSMPRDAKRFVKLHKGILYYFGLDEKGKLYYWNSRLGYRAKLFAPFYACDPFSIVNPKTEDNFYPDSLTYPKGWEIAGTIKHGLKLLIGCSEVGGIYKLGQPVGIRSGIIHANLEEEVFLAKAYYSPSKGGHWPPDYTLHIDAPEDAKKRGMAYLGDDCIAVNKPILKQIKVPPGRVFNPSRDNCYYEHNNGVFMFEAPGVYRMWCTYTFDSLTSSIKVDHVDTLYSDTLEIIIIE